MISTDVITMAQAERVTEAEIFKSMFSEIWYSHGRKY